MASETASSDESSEAPGDELGARLRSAREAQDLSIEDVASELRISIEALTSIEASQFAALGAPVFAKGYLKQYAARLGLNPAEIVDAYQAKVGSEPDIDIKPSRTITLRDERQITIWITAGVILAGLAAALIYWWLGQPAALDAASSLPNASAPAAAESAAMPAASEPVSSLPAAPLPGAEQATSAPADTPGVAATAASTAAPPVGDARDDAATEPATSTAAAPATTVAAEATEAVAGPILEVRFVEDSWTEITAADGTRLFYALGRAGTDIELPASDDMSLFFGNARGVELGLDGESIAIPASARRGELARFELGEVGD
ncbi:MAG: DUF4115 domain-containing protein [Gammaproteobacteria bacterium]|nr:DUF4115 domain-containing protein [Gammaproteobacteria bacterium]